MPCYEVQVITVEFKAEHLSLLQNAVQSLGRGWNIKVANKTATVATPDGTVTIDLEKGQASFGDGLQSRVNELKRAYSFRAVMTAARTAGWTWRGQYGQNGQNKTQGVLVRGVR